MYLLLHDTSDNEITRPAATRQTKASEVVVEALHVMPQ
jgi:hypothetical protein